ncbi:MAG: SUMF1/EgtB/PvdO family nonheme iron enzyme [Chlorobiaceae bacterium]|nr:SUMF1/EgtB/PvdO family nonheme iron enzyme [Chlorobiaceae bacterium]
MEGVFLCHAGEDKDFVRPLADELRKRGIGVWYDEYSLELGDSLTGKIDKGLAESSFGVVVLSKHFFGKAWPERELTGLATRELGERKKVILPIWHKITLQDVLAAHPPLADKLGIDTSKGLQAVVDAIISTLGERSDVFVTLPEIDVEIGQFPVTNFEYRRFIEDGGYTSIGLEKWWSNLGREVWAAYIERKTHRYFWDERRREDIPFEHPMFWENIRYNKRGQPVVGVSWFEAEAYCNWLSAYLSRTKAKDISIRLPTEEEWRFAAVGKKEIAYPWGNGKPNNKLAHFGDKQGKPSVIGQYPEGVSWAGCHDLVGNVWEWAHEFLSEKASSTMSDHFSVAKILGGCVFDSLSSLKEIPCAYRRPGYRHSVIGFRILRELRRNE